MILNDPTIAAAMNITHSAEGSRISGSYRGTDKKCGESDSEILAHFGTHFYHNWGFHKKEKSEPKLALSDASNPVGLECYVETEVGNSVGVNTANTTGKRYATAEVCLKANTKVRLVTSVVC